MITWHKMKDLSDAPKDRPIGLLSLQAQESGGFWVSLHVGQWREETVTRGGVTHVEAGFHLGMGFESGVGDSCATHWCEVGDLSLPLKESAEPFRICTDTPL